MKTASIKSDTTLFENAIKELNDLGKSTNGLAQLTDAFLNSVSDVELIKFVNKTALGTEDITVIVKPSDCLCEFLVTLRTKKREFLASST